MSVGEDRGPDETTNGHMAIPPAHSKTVAIVTSNKRFVKTMRERTPVHLFYDHREPTEARLVSKIVKEDPDVILVADKDPHVSSYGICEEIKKQCAIPVVLLHDEGYNHRDLGRVSDMDTLFPSGYAEYVNLSFELARIALGVPSPKVSVHESEPHSAAIERRALTWRLSLGLLTSLVSGIIFFGLLQDPLVAIQAAAATFSAITGMELASVVRRYAAREVRGASSPPGRSSRRE